MNSAAFNHLCLVCGRPTSQWCSRCRAACRPSASNVSNMIAMPPTAELEYISVSAILFLADEERPRMVTVKCRPPHRPSDVCPVPLLQPYFDAPADSIILTQGLSGELLRFPLHVFYSPTALAKGTPMSRSIHHITSGAAAKPWCGEVVALKYTEASSNDLPALSAYFLSYQ
ncbi:hypothetical protein B0H13DRAFT_2234852 [Mycena leptocephala]|nr:hypothetical protein B0H13DRAFT_2234852 [Mycena leptocephala]